MKKSLFILFLVLLSISFGFGLTSTYLYLPQLDIVIQQENMGVLVKRLLKCVSQYLPWRIPCNTVSVFCY